MKTKNRIWSWSLIVIGLVLILTNSCKKSDQGQLPVVFTTEVLSVWPTGVNFSGKITSNGGSRLSEQGFCLSTGHLPVITDNKFSAGFRCLCPYSIITKGLSPQTDYYVRAYATNSSGTAYGEELPFTTPADRSGETGTVEDADGNIYQTIGIGSQIWMAENLKTTKYNNGESIIPYWWYDDNEANKTPYGALYNWYTVETGKLCPSGWHVSSGAEWTALVEYLGGDIIASGKLKEKGAAHWTTPDSVASNSSGFTALPGGVYFMGYGFYNMGIAGVWWTADKRDETAGWARTIADSYSGVNISPYNTFNSVLSIRCIKDN